MSLNDRETEWLEGLFQNADSTPENMSKWERDVFLADQRTRYEEHGTSMRLSAKQWACLFSIAKKLGYSAEHGRNEDDEDEGYT